MQIDKEFVLQELRKQGKNEHVQKAIQELPAKIDHDKHAGPAREVRTRPRQTRGACRRARNQLITFTIAPSDKTGTSRIEPPRFGLHVWRSEPHRRCDAEETSSFTLLRSRTGAARARCSASRAARGVH